MSDYYAAVGDYFDDDAAEFDARYWANPVLQRIRQAFREEVKRLPFRSALEVGCGPGLDLKHFATIYPDRRIHGIDVSAGMVDAARARISAAGVEAGADVASVDDAPSLFGRESFDLAYVFFGALNTVEDLHRSAGRLYDALTPGGHLVLTFVNRWYLLDMLVHLLKGRPGQATARLRKVWGGYSPDRDLQSRCYSPRDVTRAFTAQGVLIRRRGFSIVYPAWYRSHWLKKMGRIGPRLWKADEWINRTPAWATGEYTLYVFQKPLDESRPGTRRT